MEETKKEEALKKDEKEKESGYNLKDEIKWPPMIRFIMNGGKFI